MSPAPSAPATATAATTAERKGQSAAPELSSQASAPAHKQKEVPPPAAKDYSALYSTPLTRPARDSPSSRSLSLERRAAAGTQSGLDALAKLSDAASSSSYAVGGVEQQQQQQRRGSASVGVREDGDVDVGGGDGGRSSVVMDAEFGTKCSNCGTSTTPLWRRTNEGLPICNACGEHFP